MAAEGLPVGVVQTFEALEENFILLLLQFGFFWESCEQFSLEMVSQLRLQ